VVAQPAGMEIPLFVQKGLYKFKGKRAKKTWAVFAGWARMIDRFDWQGPVTQHGALCVCTYANSQVS
jgi:hypothetical protein